ARAKRCRSVAQWFSSGRRFSSTFAIRRLTSRRCRNRPLSRRPTLRAKWSLKSEATMAPHDRLLVKLRPSASLGAAASGVSLTPLYDTPAAAGFGIASTPQWFIAEMTGGAATPWDLAHARVADQLGVADSDVIFAEPDIVHTIFRDTNEVPPGQTFAAGEDCTPTAQDDQNGKAAVAGVFAWHLRDDFSQLGSARAAVNFREPRTRIAHVDTGYFPTHVTVPRNLNHDLERSFVEGDANPGSAVN